MFPLTKEYLRMGKTINTTTEVEESELSGDSCLVYRGDTYEDICSFCSELRGDEKADLFMILGFVDKPSEYILYEDERFGVIPCVGAMTDEYYLIIPKAHVLSSGWMSQSDRAHLVSLMQQMRETLADEGKKVVFFEHGSHSFRNKGGNCYDHAHVHAVVTDLEAADFIREIPAQVDFHRTDNWIESAYEILTEGQASYVSIEDGLGSHIGVAVNVPSQFFRQALARALGVSAAESDWIAYPQESRVKAMFDRKFDFTFNETKGEIS